MPGMGSLHIRRNIDRIRRVLFGPRAPVRPLLFRHSRCRRLGEQNRGQSEWIIEDRLLDLIACLRRRHGSAETRQIARGIQPRHQGQRHTSSDVQSHLIEEAGIKIDQSPRPVEPQELNLEYAEIANLSTKAMHGSRQGGQGWQQLVANTHSHRPGSQEHLGRASGDKKFSSPIDEARHRMDTFITHLHELLQDRQVGGSLDVALYEKSSFALQRFLVFGNQLGFGMNNTPLIVSETMDVCARLDENGIAAAWAPEPQDHSCCVEPSSATRTTWLWRQHPQEAPCRGAAASCPSAADTPENTARAARHLP